MQHDGSGRVPPHSVETEQAVLGAMMIDGGALDQGVSVLSDQNAFYLPKHTLIFEAIVSLAKRNEPVDLVTVGEELRKRKALGNIGGPVYLTELSVRVATAANTETHARMIVELALSRKLITTMTRRISDAYDPGNDVFEVLDRAQNDLFQASESLARRSATDLNQIIKETMQGLDALRNRGVGATGVPSGFAKLDEITGGWQKSDLVIIAGRPSMGKCVAGDTPLLLSDGRFASIAELFARRDAQLFTLSDGQRFESTAPSAYHFDGVKPVFRVDTALGRSVRTTLTHPFLTRRGWEPLSSLAAGTHIAVPRELAVFGNESAPDAVLSGLARTLVHGPRPLPGRGLRVAAPAVCTLPGWTFTLTRRCLAAFVHRLFARRARLVVAHANVARQLAHLLLRLGILAAVKRVAREWSVTILDPAWPRRLRHTEDHSPQIVFDAITGITPVGRQPVYDLTVDDTHNFVASDVCVHNTAFALSCARNAALDPMRSVPSAIFSLEMSSHQLAQRLLTMEAGVNAHNTRSGRISDGDFDRLLHAAGRFSAAKLFIDDTPNLSVLELRAKARQLCTRHGIGLVVVDYLQMMRGIKNEHREQEIAQISRSLKALAKELDIPVVALSQLNRNVEDRKDKRPQLADLRESGAIEQDADVVAFIYRPEVYGIDHYKNDNTSTENTAEVIVGKHRNGRTGAARLAFTKDYARFANLDPYGPVPEVEEDIPLPGS